MQSATYPVLSMYENTNHDYLTTQICLTNSTDKTVAFKVKTNSPDRMFISPIPMGILEPHSKLDLDIRAPTTFFTVGANINVLIQSGYIPNNNLEIINSNRFWDPTNNSEMNNTFLRIRPSHNESHSVEVGNAQETTSTTLASVTEASIHVGEKEVENHCPAKSCLIPVVVNKMNEIKDTKDVFGLEKRNSQRLLEAGDAPQDSQSHTITKPHERYSESTWTTDSNKSKSDVMDQLKMVIFDDTQSQTDEESEQLHVEQVPEKARPVLEEAKTISLPTVNPYRHAWSTIENGLTIIMNNEGVTSLKWPILYIIGGLLFGWLFV